MVLQTILNSLDEQATKVFTNLLNDEIVMTILFSHIARLC